VNAMVAATDMTGYRGRFQPRLPHEVQKPALFPLFMVIYQHRLRTNIEKTQTGCTILSQELREILRKYNRLSS
jgi:hypothetical protein